jgi:hypothetical protein
MKFTALMFSFAVLVACSGRSETPTRKTADGLAYHPSPGQTGDGIPVPPTVPAAKAP